MDVVVVFMPNALRIADQYIQSGVVGCALVVGADSLTKFVD